MTPTQAAAHAARALRVLVAALVLSALVWSTITSAQDGTLPQHLSYFTNQSNLFFVLLVGGGLLLGGRRPSWWEDARGAVAFSLAMTGIVYALLVAPLDELLRWDIGWTGIVLHRLAPIAAVADWVLTPRDGPVRARRILLWQIYPVVFLLATWARGGITGWYPYAFLDPTASSWSQVLVTTAVVLVAFFTIAALIHLAQGLAARQKVPAVEGEPALP